MELIKKKRKRSNKENVQKGNREKCLNTRKGKKKVKESKKSDRKIFAMGLKPNARSLDPNIEQFYYGFNTMFNPSILMERNIQLKSN